MVLLLGAVAMFLLGAVAFVVPDFIYLFRFIIIYYSPFVIWCFFQLLILDLQCTTVRYSIAYIPV